MKKNKYGVPEIAAIAGLDFTEIALALDGGQGALANGHAYRLQRSGAASPRRGDAGRGRERCEGGDGMWRWSGARQLGRQAARRRTRGGLAAPPGQSNHGWGLAVDFCPSVYEGRSGRWLHDVGPVFGWDNPEWARGGGSAAYEPWHWEYVPGVTAIAAAGLTPSA